jgi:hypothetical protein
MPISDNVVPISPFFLLLWSRSGAVKKYPTNRMVGQRQVTDGKVKAEPSQIYLFSQRFCPGFRMSSSTVFLIHRPVSMCGKRTRKCARRS